MTLTAFKTNTDDLSPAPDAWSRPDIPLHALAMLKNPREGIPADVAVGIDKLKELGHPLAYVGDVVGTGSSRKSATNSVLWYMGDDLPYIPNKRGGGICIGTKIAPIFYNTLEFDVSTLEMGDVIEVFPYE
ncbi:aconitate hydratase 2 N-terminus-domain-containing protein, partial [Pavlovales sp. CCMP2436]